MKRAALLLLAGCGGSAAPPAATPSVSNTAQPPAADGCRDTSIVFQRISPGGIRTLTLSCSDGAIVAVVTGTEHNEPREPVTRPLERETWDELWAAAQSAGEASCIANPDEDYERVIELTRDGDRKQASCQGVWTVDWALLSDTLEELAAFEP